jgi:hypothetical protein
MKALGGLLGGGGGNPDSHFGVGKQRRRQTYLIGARRYDDADRSAVLAFATGRYVEEKKRFKPGLPWDLGGGVKNYSVVSHYGHQTLPRLSDSAIIALGEPGGASSTSNDLGVVPAIPGGPAPTPAANGGPVPGAAPSLPLPLVVGGVAVLAVKALV